MLVRTRVRAFFAAAESANVGLLKQVLADGTDDLPLDERCQESGRTALDSVVRHGKQEHTYEHLDCALLLIEAGAHIDAFNGSAMVSAASLGCNRCLALLLMNNAKAEGTRGVTALGLAMSHKSDTCARLLVDFGANPEAVDSKYLSNLSAERAFAIARTLSGGRARFVQRQLLARERIYQKIMEQLCARGLTEKGVGDLVFVYVPVDDWPVKAGQIAEIAYAETAKQKNCCCVIC